ncbi:MAG: WD40 repeat domain-containing protein, partial [Gemmatimonas sp.]
WPGRGPPTVHGSFRGGPDGIVRFWYHQGDAHRAAAVGGPASPGRHRPWVEHLAWSPDGALCAVAAGAHVSLWTADGSLVRRYAPLRSTVADVQWLPDGHRLSASGYGGVTVWSRHDDAPVDQLDWKGSFFSHAWSPNGKWLAAGMQESAVHIFEIASRGNLEMTGYHQKVTRLAFSSDGKKLVTNGGPYACVWNFAGAGPAGTSPVSLGGHVLPISDVAFYRQGLWVATGAEDGQVLMWDLTQTTRRPVATAFAPSGVQTLTWHPRERRLFSAHQDGWVHSWAAVR